ncbi:MAG TPA: YHS domain-containing protein [Blastocatellia bacterium]|nr:YHS domain-containing protein [Blastocatellia bacterium]
MRKVAIGVLLLMVFAGAVVAQAADGEKKPVTNKMCPVMNSAASEKYRTEYKGQYVYFCCQGCIKMFEKDPEGYVAKMSKEDQEAIKANTVCPITEDPITDHTRFVEHEGRKVYLCCDGCVTTYKKKIAAKTE